MRPKDERPSALAVCALLGTVFAGSPSSEATEFCDADFQVNTYTTSYPRSPSVAV
jgi:hypothetical protein